MEQPVGFKNATHPDYVCQLRRLLYGLKQAPRAWFERLYQFFHSLGFDQSQADHSLFWYCQSNITLLVLVYVDDILLTSSAPTAIDWFLTQIQDAFPIRNLGELHYFLSIVVRRVSQGYILSQHKYVHDILHEVGLYESQGCSTPMATYPNLSKRMGSPLLTAPRY
jgi:hypothetical protein